MRAVSNLMQSLLASAPLPLLARELTEQAARKRTFALRVTLACLLYGVAIWASWSLLSHWSTNAFSILGQGRTLFDALAAMQFAFVYLFLPAMTCGTLTSEKERDTLSLLLLTKLGPWTILLEKLLSRMFPMVSILLLSMPLMAISYSLGGVEMTHIVTLGWVLLTTLLQVGSLAILCSAWCRTTAAAFLSVYLIGAAVILGPLAFIYGEVSDLVFFMFSMLDSIGVWAGAYGPTSDPDLLSANRAWMLSGSHVQSRFSFFGPGLVLTQQGQGVPFVIMFLRTIPMLAFSATCLVLARIVLWRRAFLVPSNCLLKIFRSLDAFFHKANENRYTKGIVLIKENVALPENDPIRWRETKKRSLGTTRYLIRMLIALELPVVVGLLFPLNVDSSESAFASAYVTAWVVWIIAAMVIIVHSTGLIGLERSKQTLDVLLTTRLSSETIVREKFAGVRRLILILWVPFLSIYLYQIWWRSAVQFNTYNRIPVLFTIIKSLATVAIYPSLLAWVGFHVGMRSRSQTKAVLATVGLLVAICVLPIAIAEVGWSSTVTQSRGQMSYFGSESWSFLTYFLFVLKWLSPVQTLAWVDISQPHYFGPTGHQQRDVMIGLIWHFLVYGNLLIYLQHRAIKSFAAHVHRNDGQIINDDDIERLSSMRRKIVSNRVFHRDEEL